MSENEPSSQSVRLFLAQDEKIDSLRGDVSEVRDAIAEYVRRLDVIEANGKHTDERLEKGVSNTAFKAWEKVQSLETLITKIDGHLTHTDIIVETLGNRQDRTDKFNSQVLYGILITVFLSIFSTVMIFLWNFKIQP